MKRKNKKYTPEEIAHMRQWGVRAERATELIPPICAGIMIIHDLALCLGYRWQWTETIVILLAVVLMVLFSFALGFCNLHRCFIIYNWMMLFCIHYERTVGFADFLQPMHYIMLGIGICLLIQLHINKIKKKKCK